VKRAVWILIGLAAVAALAVTGVGLQANNFLNSPVTVAADGTSFEIESGSAFAQVSNELANRGIIEHPDFFRWYARVTGMAAAVHAGEYEIAAGTTPKQLLVKFVSGEVQLYSMTIVEGWNFRELMAALQASSLLEHSIVHEDWPAILESFAAEATHPEGLFLPETYSFPKGTTDINLLQQAFDLMQSTLQAEWEGRDGGLPIASPYEALILASIVEKETALATERPRIAGVFTRRLEKRMRLQTDPTVIYGIGVDFNGNLTRRDLRTDTPYNTYTRHGLPPTPIALPGKAAIHAALHPAAGNELYFVATGSGDGSHKFSETKAEHDAAVQEYLVRLRATRNKRQGQ
jgi:UPF0755 protein